MIMKGLELEMRKDAGSRHTLTTQHLDNMRIRTSAGAREIVQRTQRSPVSQSSVAQGPKREL